MGISVEEAVKEIQGRENIYVAYSQVTKLPYVTCGEETFNDQVWFFAEEEGVKEFGQKKLEEKILLMGMKYEKKDFPRMYGLLFSIGVNSVVWNRGDEQIEIDLDKIVREPDISKIPEEKRPLINPTLQLSGIYFMQELRRPGQKKDDPERSRKLQELEEEMTADLYRSRFILAVDVSKVPEGQDPAKSGANVQIPYVKTPSGDMYQPLFTDVWEFQKFQKKPEMKLRMAAVDFQKLLPSLVPQAKGFILNPGGVNLVLSREQLTSIGKRYGQ